MPAFYIEGDEPKLADPSGRSLHKINNLLKIIEAKTGSATITGPVTVTNEVEVTNSSGSPIPVSGTVTANTGLTQPLTDTQLRTTAVPISGTVTVNDMTSGNAKTKIVDSVGADVSYITAGTAGTPSSSVLSVQGISGGTAHAVTGPLTDTQLRAAVVPVSLGTSFVGDNFSFGSNPSHVRIGFIDSENTNMPVTPSFPLPVTGPLTDTQLRAAVVPVSLASVPSHAVTQATAANLNATVVGSGSFTAAQATASSLKAQAQILDSAGALLTYGSTGVAGSPSSDVITVQGASAGTAVNTKILNSSGTAVTYAETGTYGSPSVDVLSVQNPQGVTATITTFTSTTASTSLVAVGSTRKALTVYNSGAGDLYISPTAVCTTTNFQLKLSSGDFWECPPSQVLLSHTAVFSTSGSTAYITSLT